MKSDLHIHTNYSDGVFSPEKVVDAAIDVGLDVIALTDHDNILSFEIAQRYLETLKGEGKKTITVIQGIEVNTIHQNEEIHVLGYFMEDRKSTRLNSSH